MINIVFGVDGYVAQMAVSMVSLFESNRHNDIKIYVVCIHLQDTDRQKLDKMASKYERKITYLNMDTTKLDKLKAFFHLTKATFYRLFIPSMLPHLEKVIYLDCDIIVEADLARLWEKDVSDCGNAGVIFNGKDTENRLGVQGGKDMNAGILIMNLEYWRKHNITSQCTDWLERTESIYMDNDAMNVVLHGAQKGIEEIWNLNPIHFAKYSEESNHPSRILHFAGAIKPWHKAYDFKFQEKYIHYLRKTPWIEEYKPEEPWNISQAVSVANQYFENGEYIQACGYYNLALKFRLITNKLESVEVLDVLNNGIKLQSEEKFSEAAENFRRIIKFWGFPTDHHCNIYQFPGIALSMPN